MPCVEALITDPVVIRPGDTVSAALAKLEEHRIRTAPVVDDNGKLIGMFGLHCLMEDLLPMAAQIEDGLQGLDFIVGGTPSAAKKIRKIGPRLVKDHMDPRKLENIVLYPDIEMLETMLTLTKRGSPLPVVERNTHKFLGLVSEQSCLRRLNLVLQEVEAEENAVKAQAAG